MDVLLDILGIHSERLVETHTTNIISDDQSAYFGNIYLDHPLLLVVVLDLNYHSIQYASDHVFAD